MPSFDYQAVTADGEVRNGLIQAADQHIAVELLQRQGLIPMSVEPSSGGSQKASSLLSMQIGRPRVVSNKQMVAFTQDLSALLVSGITLDRALEIMQKVSREELVQQLLSNVQEGVRRGQSLSRVLAEQPGVFSNFYINMVQAAEVSGSLGDGLNDLANYLERSRELREKTLSAVLYPAILLLVAALSLIIILTYVVPQFEQLFSDMGQALPLATRIVISVAGGVRDYGVWVLLALLLLGFYLRSLLRKPDIRLRWDLKVLQLPLWGALSQKLEMARFSRSLGTLVKGGVPLLNALKIAKNTLVNTAMAEVIETATSGVKEGSRLAEPLLESGIFPPLALQMIQVGEETGQLDTMLLKVADVYDREVSTAIQRMLTILEPVLIVGLGILIAGIILSILVAIMSINQLPV
ncbi:MAG: type II secretion system F family protein [Amphritea sp.]